MQIGNSKIFVSITTNTIMPLWCHISTSAIQNDFVGYFYKSVKKFLNDCSKTWTMKSLVNFIHMTLFYSLNLDKFEISKTINGILGLMLKTTIHLWYNRGFSSPNFALIETFLISL